MYILWTKIAVALSAPVPPPQAPGETTQASCFSRGEKVQAWPLDRAQEGGIWAELHPIS